MPFFSEDRQLIFIAPKSPLDVWDQVFVLDLLANRAEPVVQGLELLRGEPLERESGGQRGFFLLEPG